MAKPFPIEFLVLGAVAVATGIGMLYWTKRGRQRRQGRLVGHVCALNVYPVKSCGGTSVTKAAVEPRGIVFDRLYMVVLNDGTFRTQRQIPAMALIKPTLPTDPDDPLRLDAPGMPQISVSVVREGEGRSVDVRVWSDTVKGVDQGEEVARWLSTLLKEDNLRLVRFADSNKRQVDSEFAPIGQTTAFADGFPFLLISQESLDALNKRLEQPIPMNRFRPNIVVRGVEPFAEDTWDEIRIGEMEMRVVKPCDRCKIPNTDQATGEVTQEPGNTLRAFRTGKDLKLRDGWKNAIFFGENLVHNGASGMIRVGDPIIVYSTQQ